MTLPPIAVPARLAMTYPYKAEGAERDRELPFRVGVIADLAKDPGVPLPQPDERRFLTLGGDGIAGATVYSLSAQPLAAGTDHQRRAFGRGRRLDFPASASARAQHSLNAQSLTLNDGEKIHSRSTSTG